ncbi:MAG: hypothetical protein Q8P31_02735, partial [Bacillota bacterium]|nr:hypothetical protein [Bacillota bacterium]
RIADAQAQVKALSGTYGRVAELCKVAARFGKKVPAKYASVTANSTSNGNIPGVRYTFEGFGSTDKRMENCTLSRGLVIATPGCEGLGLDGRLHKAEFVDYLASVGKALPEKVGDEVEVTLKNSRSGKIRRIT